RAYERLFADHVLAGRKRGHDLPVVDRGWCADIYDVNVVHGEDFIEGRAPALDIELAGERRKPLGIHIAERDHAVPVAVGQIALEDVGAADPASHDGDRQTLRHGLSLFSRRHVATWQSFRIMGTFLSASAL